MIEIVANDLIADIAYRYELRELVGLGGFGAIYRAHDNRFNIPVAIKVLLIDLPDEHDIRRFKKEAQILANITSLHVVRVFDFGLSRSRIPYIVMGWIDGEDLNYWIRAKKAINEMTAVPWMRQVCQGMIDATRKKIVHRDISMANILIDQDNNAILTDFGLAFTRTPQRGNGRARPGLGNVNYCSPEQGRDANRADQRSDIYSFGATFYHVLTGKPPFMSADHEDTRNLHAQAQLEWPAAAKKAVSGSMRSLIERCMAKKPNDRFQTFKDVLADLNTNFAAQPPHKEAVECITTFSGRVDSYLGQKAARRHSDVFKLGSDRSIIIKHGDLSLEKADAIVSAASEKLTMSGGVSKALCDRGGEEIREQAIRFSPVRDGRVVVTSAGALKARFVFHAVTINFSKKDVLLPNIDTINNILDSCFYHAETLGIKTIAMPLLGTGLGGFSPELCLDTMFRNIVYKLSSGTTSVKKVSIVLYDGRA